MMDNFKILATALSAYYGLPCPYIAPSFAFYPSILPSTAVLSLPDECCHDTPVYQISPVDPILPRMQQTHSPCKPASQPANKPLIYLLFLWVIAISSRAPSWLQTPVYLTERWLVSKVIGCHGDEKLGGHLPRPEQWRGQRLHHNGNGIAMKLTINLQICSKFCYIRTTLWYWWYYFNHESMDCIEKYGAFYHKWVCLPTIDNHASFWSKNL